jgi:hypothetical protein
MTDRQHEIADLIKNVALVGRQELHGWRTHGPIGDRIQRAFVDFNHDRYTLVRDEDRAVLVFTPREWDAFVDGIDKGEFNEEAGIEDKEPEDELA